MKAYTISVRRCLLLPKAEAKLKLEGSQIVQTGEARVYSERARRNELTAKNTKSKATATETATSQLATLRVHARKAEFSQPSAKIANMAPTAS
jgi:hypothetical protein